MHLLWSCPVTTLHVWPGWEQSCWLHCQELRVQHAPPPSYMIALALLAQVVWHVLFHILQAPLPGH